MKEDQMPTNAAEAVTEAGSETRARVPANVVYRVFPGETVLLNLETGKYHGLNPTGGRMYELLDKSGTVESAASALAAEYGRDPAEVLNDIRVLCASLEERNLIEIDERGATG